MVEHNGDDRDGAQSVDIGAVINVLLPHRRSTEAREIVPRHRRVQEATQPTRQRLVRFQANTQQVVLVQHHSGLSLPLNWSSKVVDVGVAFDQKDIACPEAVLRDITGQYANVTNVADVDAAL